MGWFVVGRNRLEGCRRVGLSCCWVFRFSGFVVLVSLSFGLLCRFGGFIVEWVCSRESFCFVGLSWGGIVLRYIVEWVCRFAGFLVKVGLSFWHMGFS